MNKWYVLVLLVQSSFLWSAASGRDENRLHAAIKGIDNALAELHTDMQDIKGNIATTAQHSPQLTSLVEKIDSLNATQQLMLAELQKQNTRNEMIAKAKVLTALIATPKEIFPHFMSSSRETIEAAIRSTSVDLAKLVQQKKMA